MASYECCSPLLRNSLSVIMILVLELTLASAAIIALALSQIMDLTGWCHTIKFCHIQILFFSCTSNYFVRIGK